MATSMKRVDDKKNIFLRFAISRSKMIFLSHYEDLQLTKVHCIRFQKRGGEYFSLKGKSYSQSLFPRPAGYHPWINIQSPRTKEPGK